MAGCRAGADPSAWDEEGLTPLHYSASHDHFEVSQLLLENGADPNAADAEGNTALDMVPEDHEDMFQLLIDGGVDAEDEGPELLALEGPEGGGPPLDALPWHGQGDDEGAEGGGVR